jgi:nucleoid-associated protein YgaU
MMRKDVRVGFVVGGILVAVLIAVALVSGPKQRKHSGAELATAENPPGDQSAPTDRPASPADASAARSAEGPSPATQPADPFNSAPSTVATADQKKNEPTAEDKWMLALNNGVMPMMTANPVPPGSSVRGRPVVSTSAPPAQVDPQSPNVNADPPPSAPPVNIAGPSTLPTNPAAPRTHVVQSGETIVKIAAAAYGSPNYWPYIKRANPNVVPEKLRPGQTLVLPSLAEVKGNATMSSSVGSTTIEANSTSTSTVGSSPNVDPKTQYVVQTGDSLHKIALKLYGNSQKWEAIYAMNKDQIGADPARLKLHSVLKLPDAPTVK